LDYRVSEPAKRRVLIGMIVAGVLLTGLSFTHLLALSHARQAGPADLSGREAARLVLPG
jgi:hypothetical protein